MTFREWITAPFSLLASAASSKAKAAGSVLSFLERPLVTSAVVGVLAGFAGGLASRVQLPTVNLPSFPSRPAPAPIPAKGLHVLMLVDTSKSLPADQQLALTSGDVRAYLNATCPVGADGQTREWRLWDASVNATNESPLWQDALARAKGKPLPWVIVSNPDKGGGFEGPLPANSAALLDLLKKYGG